MKWLIGIRELKGIEIPNTAYPALAWIANSMAKHTMFSFLFKKKFLHVKILVTGIVSHK